MNKTMREQSLELQDQLQDQVPPEILNVFYEYAEELGNTDFHTKSVGDISPDFELLDATGQLVTLSDILKKGPVVLTFYRGNWCPWCNLQLRILQDLLPEINDLGANLIAISPQTPDNSLSIKEKHDLTFHVLSDQGNKVAEEYGLVFEIDKNIIENAYNKISLSIPDFNGAEEWKIPVTATFVIDQKNIIQSSHVNGDFRYRQEPSVIIDALKNII
jgi:peroxiredoxin